MHFRLTIHQNRLPEGERDKLCTLLSSACHSSNFIPQGIRWVHTSTCVTWPFKKYCKSQGLCPRTLHLSSAAMTCSRVSAGPAGLSGSSDGTRASAVLETLEAALETSPTQGGQRQLDMSHSVAAAPRPHKTKRRGTRHRWSQQN